ncbi:MAG: crosslink repair DNA glycosylase YcaQ family protein [Anaerolineaceae bacterium]
MINLTRSEARLLLLRQHFLDVPRSLHGKSGITTLFQRLGCIQYDPVNIIGTNPYLVLQSRVADFTPTLLDEMLYSDRTLWDGFDKVMSIYQAQDWPYFSRCRERMVQSYGNPQRECMRLSENVMQTIRDNGPSSSIDFDHDERTDWHWGPTRLVRATLESLFFMGKLGIHHRTGTRRSFDLVERLLPAELLTLPDPNISMEDYYDWHFLRRIGSMGFADSSAGDKWLGVLYAKTRERQASIKRLMDKGLVDEATIEDLPRNRYLIRTADLPLLSAPTASNPLKIAFLPPLDNLLWDRRRLKDLFNFEYTWEVYVPASKRKYGHYTMPVLYGDRFIARFDPILDRKAHQMTIQNWWWEEGIQPGEEMISALQEAFASFAFYLNVEKTLPGENVQNDIVLMKVFGF